MRAAERSGVSGENGEDRTTGMDEKNKSDTGMTAGCFVRSSSLPLQLTKYAFRDAVLQTQEDEGTVCLSQS